MKFVSKYTKFGFNARGGSQRWVKDPSGSERQVDNNDGIYLQFKPGGLSYDEQQSAIEQFTKVNPQSPWGAAPKMNDDVISAQEAMSEGEAHNAHDGFLPFQRIGMFDTEDPSQCPSGWKEEAEQALLGASEFGIDLFRIDNYNLTPPWPAYPTQPGAKADGILSFAQQGGHDLAQILRYEKATTARKGLIEALENAIATQATEAADEAALAIKQ